MYVTERISRMVILASISENVILNSLIGVILIIATFSNSLLLLVFHRRPGLRTISNRWVFCEFFSISRVTRDRVQRFLNNLSSRRPLRGFNCVRLSRRRTRKFRPEGKPRRLSPTVFNMVSSIHRRYKAWATCAKRILSGNSPLRFGKFFIVPARSEQKNSKLSLR